MTYIIAEIGINHNGDIQIAKELINLASTSGCNAVKFQKRDIDLVYTKEELNKYRESPWGTTNREQKEGIEFSLEQYKELEQYATSKKLDFIVSCWDPKSVDDVERACNVKYHKVASALATDTAFLKKLNATGKPVILSVGMCDGRRIAAAMSILDNVEYLLACTSTYPTKAEDVNLRHITTLQAQYPNTAIGFSNHYSGADACMGAVALGAQCIEFHITLDRTMYGSDQASSIHAVGPLCHGIRNMEKMISKKDKLISPEEASIAQKLRKIDDV